MEAMLGLEIAEPDVLDVLDVLGGEIGLARPLLHFGHSKGCLSHHVSRERLEFR